MSFSKEWNSRYKNNTNMSIWPWSDLVSYVMRYARPDNKNFRVLELGCGAGANIPFFESLGIEYFGIDGSKIMIQKLKEKFPEIAKNITSGDFTKGIPFSGDFDLIIDRSALTHNPTKGIKYCLNNVYDRLKLKGKFIGIDWFSTMHSEYQKGEPDEDIFTKKKYQTGQFTHVGRVHFSDKPHLLELFTKFNILILEHKIVNTEIPNEEQKFASWNIVAQK